MPFPWSNGFCLPSAQSEETDASVADIVKQLEKSLTESAYGNQVQ
jgi:hypothetical protein